MHKIKRSEMLLICMPFLFSSCKAGSLSPAQAIEPSEPQIALPSYTAYPATIENTTAAPHPVSSPLPTPLQTPGVLDCAAIVQAHKDSTASQWERTSILFRGRQIYYIGLVHSVTETDIVHLTGSLCHATLHHVPHEVAINLSRGQQIEGYGIIKNINDYRGEDVDIEVDPDSLFVH